MPRGADEHLTSTEAARLLGVSAATIKRWSDEGVISTVRTPGGHRRFRRLDVSLAAERLFTRTGGPELAELLLSRRTVLEIQAHILSERARLGSWAAVVDACTPVLMAVSARGRSGAVPYLTIAIARQLLQDALSRCADEMPTLPDAPRVLVAAVDGELPEIDPTLVRLCFRAASWTAWSVGHREPPELSSFVASGAADVVTLCAGVTRSRASLDAVLASVLPACSRAGASLVLAGVAPWPSPPPPAVIARTTAELQAWIEAAKQPATANGARP